MKGMKRAAWLGVLVLAWWGVSSKAKAQFAGIYTDKPGYAPGETIVIHGAAPPGQALDVVFRLVRIGDASRSYGRSKQGRIVPANTGFGSFLEVPSLTLAGRKQVTLEGWWYPTIVGTDTVALIGQLGATEAAAGILITPEGKPAVYGSATAAFDPKLAAVAPTALKLDTWVHLAAVFDGQRMRLYVDGKEVASRPFSGTIAATKAPFRVGARSEAPGDMTGIADGRLDAWAVWPKALSPQEISARIAAAKGAKDPAPPPADVSLYLGFETPYGGPKDSSAKQHAVKVYNLGVPHITGVNAGSLAFGVHHDQLIDAKWPEIGRIAVPQDAPSGFYVVHALVGPDFKVTPLASTNTWSVSIRPARPKASVAVLVPVNTWLAYNTWPGKNYATSGTDGITARPRKPGDSPNFNGGNNSAYDVRGDGVSYAYFQGWKRPSPNVQPYRGNDQGFHQRATVSRFLFDWLEREKIPYDAYTDWDLHRGHIPATGAHKLLLVHGHAEYWSRKMMERAAAFLDGGGSVIALAGNMVAWRVTLDDNGIMEIRKWPVIKHLGTADVQNAMDQKRAGSWLPIDVCDGSRYASIFGSITHMGHPCSPAPQCFGKWAATKVEHWLWRGLGVVAGQTFGSSPVAGIFSVGHETDIHHPAFPPMGLKPGTSVTILAEGKDFPAPQTFQLTDVDKFRQLTCQAFASLADGVGDIRIKGGPDSRSGHIYTYQHKGGGRVLVVGSTSATWGLLGDATLSAMIKRAIGCFVDGVGCPSAGENASEPARPTEPQPDKAVVSPELRDAASPGRSCGCQGAPSPSWWLLCLLVCGWLTLRRSAGRRQ